MLEMVRPVVKMLKIPKYNIVVGPEEEASEPYDVYINVSDTPDCQFGKHPFAYWYPINEVANWGYSPFYWSKKILDMHVALGHKILVHCHAGVCRSPAITVAWLYSMGHKRDEINKMLKDPYFIQSFERLQGDNCIPKLSEFHAAMKEHPTYSLMGCLSLIKKHMEH
jgi:hypothetical protein